MTVNTLSSHIYIGTGGYSDSDLLGTLYPLGTPSSQFLSIYQQHYDTVEINSTFHAPIGQKAIQGILEKSEGHLQFSIKIHQDFSHKRKSTQTHAQAFLTALQPLINANCLANLIIQFPQQFSRTQNHRLYLAELFSWFDGFNIAVEFRHPSWHIDTVFDYFKAQSHLIWCNVDYPPLADLPKFDFKLNQNIGYLRLHGHNMNWHSAQSAKERHDYRYTDDELKILANLIYQHKENFKQLFIYFQNTTKSHSVYNIEILKNYLLKYNFSIKNSSVNIHKNGLSQGNLF